jgi:hypothetical protein
LDEQANLMLKRIKETDDGREFIELIRRMSQNNYKAWKQSPQEYNDVFKGQAISLDGIVSMFEECTEKLNKPKVEHQEWL